MLKIAHVDTGKKLRGGQHQLLILARGLRERAHQQLIVCPESSGLETIARREGFRTFCLPQHDPGHVHGMLVLRQWLAAERFDILHAHDGRGHTLAWLGTLGMGIQRIATRRVLFAPSRLTTRMLSKSLGCNAIIAVSESVKGQLVPRGVPDRKVEVIPDGINLPEQLPGSETRARVRAAWGFSDREFVIGHVGAFTPEKGQDVAVAALGIVTEKLPQARLVLAGEGPERQPIEVAASMKQGAARVIMPGYVENLSECFAGFDLFVMPSRSEGLGSSTLLAMAHGLPVIASNVGGLPEVVEEGKTGWLVPPDSPQALADVILAVAADDACRREFGANARARAERFSSDIMIERTEALYRRLVTRQKPG